MVKEKRSMADFKFGFDELDDQQIDQEGEEEQLEQEEGVEQGLADSVLDGFAKKKKKKTILETHTKVTFMLENSLVKRLDRVARKQGRGFKTFFINQLMEKALDEIEGNDK